MMTINMRKQYILACSSLRDSGESAKRKRGRKTSVLFSRSQVIFVPSLLSESLEQAKYKSTQVRKCELANTVLRWVAKRIRN